MPKTRFEQCEGCSLDKYNRRRVIERGSKSPRIIFIGEAPGKDEDRIGVPFIGSAGRLLTWMIEKYDLKDYAITNIVRCRPPMNKMKQEYINQCRPLLYDYISEKRPELIISLGVSAGKDLICKSVRFGRFYDVVIKGEEYKLFAMIHPAAQLHNPYKGKEWQENWKVLMKHIREMNK